MSKKAKIESAIKTPDGVSGVVSFPLPKSHWIYKEHGEPPAFLKTDSIETRMQLESIFKEAVKYAVQASTMSGKEMDFDPDAMVQNFMIALFGYYPLNTPRDTIHVKKKLPNGKVLEYSLSRIREANCMRKIIEMDELISKMWHNFEPPKCKKCGSQNVKVESNIGYSEESGIWGDVWIECECGEKLILFKS